MRSPGSDSRIFIVGFGRSGTTLLRAILSRHSRIAITPETHFLKRAQAAGGPGGSPEDFERFWRRLTEWVRFRDLGIDAQAALARIEERGDHSFRAIFDTMLDAYGKRLDKPRVGEKTPSHSRYLATLLSWYPNARFLVLQRDPRGAIGSFLDTPWVREQIFPPSLSRGLATGDPMRSIAQLAAEWEDLYANRFPKWDADSRFKTVAYEQLVLQPEKEVRRICDFLGEEMEPAMIEGGDRGKVPDPSGRIPDAQLEDWRRRHEQRSKQAISAASLTKWRDRLTTSQTALIEARCRNGMRRCGYQFETPVAQRSMTSAAGWITGGAARIEERTRKALQRRARS